LIPGDLLHGETCMCTSASHHRCSLAYYYTFVCNIPAKQSNQQGLDSTHSQCTQLSSTDGLGHSYRTPLNPLLCQHSSPEIHSVE